MDLGEIIQSWIISYDPSPEEKRKAISRSKICDLCPSKKYNKYLKFFYCGVCKCPLEKKIYSPKNTCPLNNWKI